MSRLGPGVDFPRRKKGKPKCKNVVKLERASVTRFSNPTSFSAMSKLTIACCTASLFLALLTEQAGAQLTGGTTDGTSTAQGGAEGSAADMLNPDTVFSNVERGETVGSTASTGQGFSAVSSSSTTAGGARGGISGLGGFGGFGGLSNLFGGFNRSTASSATPAIRTRLRSAISGPRTSPAAIQQAANQRFRVLPSQPQLRGVNVTMQGDTAVIRGQVNSQRDRRMSQMLMMLEPGVRRVDNQITVGGQP
jgi:hypothetical protein